MASKEEICQEVRNCMEEIEAKVIQVRLEGEKVGGADISISCINF